MMTTKSLGIKTEISHLALNKLKATLAMKNCSMPYGLQADNGFNPVELSVRNAYILFFSEKVVSQKDLLSSNDQFVFTLILTLYLKFDQATKAHSLAKIWIL